jgi:hypothetical protein
MPFHHAIVTGLATSRGQQKHPNEVGPNQSAALRSDRRVGQIKMPPDPATQTPGPLQNAEPGPLQLAEITAVPLRRVRAVEGVGRLFSTPSRPALRAAACGGRPRPANQPVGVKGGFTTVGACRADQRAGVACRASQQEERPSQRAGWAVEGTGGGPQQARAGGRGRPCGYRACG